MSIITEILRTQTLPGIIAVNKVPQVTFKGWIASQTYKTSSAIQSTDFCLDVFNHEELLLPYAYDINRMASSSFESISGVLPDSNLPKSVGWLMIRSYYSAYFSMHAILRLFGTSCSQFDFNESKAITEVAKLFSPQNGVTVSNGYYKCEYSTSTKSIHCTKLNNTHQDVWKVFYDFLDNMATKVSRSEFLNEDKTLVVKYLLMLRQGLSFRGTLNSGNWLSKVRNDVNYSHSMGAWYPYKNSSHEHEGMFRLVKKWKSPPSEDMINDSISKCDHLLFVSTCVSIVSLCHALLVDLTSINSSSFLKHAPIRLISQLEAN